MASLRRALRPVAAWCHTVMLPTASRSQPVAVMPVLAAQFSSAAAAAEAARVKVSPFKEGYELREKSVGQMYSNLVHLCSRGRTPRALEFHRLLDRVEEEADMDFALDALALCRTRFVKFNDRSSAKLVEAAHRAGCLDRAVEVLAESLRYRLFPEPITFAKLAAYCSADGNAGLVGKCLDAAVGAGVELHPRSVQKFTKAFIDAGDVDGALALFEHAGAAQFTRIAAHKLVLGGAPLATTTEQVDKLAAAADFAQTLPKANTDAIMEAIADARVRVEAPAGGADEEAASDEADAEAAA